MLHRREFLALSATAALHAAVPGVLHAQQNGGDPMSRTNLGAYTQGLLTAATFERIVNTNFRVFLKDGSVTEIKLLSVHARKPQVLTARQTADIVQTTHAEPSMTKRLQSFSVLFALEGKAFPQDMYVVDSSMIGRFSVMLVPGIPGTCHASFSTFDAGEAKS